MVRDVTYYSYDNAYKILRDKKFFVKIPKIYIYTEQEKELYGIPVDEINGEIDRKSVMELVDSYKSVYELAEIASEGATILIKNEDDILNVLKIAGEALDILKSSPVGGYEEKIENTIFNLEALVERIQNTHGDYLAKLNDKHDKVKNYLNDTFGVFNQIYKATNVNRRAQAFDLNNNETNKRVYGTDFDKISL